MILHPSKSCVACGTFSGYYMNALISRDTSFLEARENHECHYAQNISNSHIHELNATINALTKENTKLKRQLAIASHLGKDHLGLPYQSLGPQRAQTLVIKGHRTALYAGREQALGTCKVVNMSTKQRIALLSTMTSNTNMSYAAAVAQLLHTSTIPPSKEIITIKPWPEHLPPRPEILLEYYCLQSEYLSLLVLPYMYILHKHTIIGRVDPELL